MTFEEAIVSGLVAGGVVAIPTILVYWATRKVAKATDRVAAATIATNELTRILSTEPHLTVRARSMPDPDPAMFRPVLEIFNRGFGGAENVTLELSYPGVETRTHHFDWIGPNEQKTWHLEYNREKAKPWINREVGVNVWANPIGGETRRIGWWRITFKHGG